MSMYPDLNQLLFRHSAPTAAAAALTLPLSSSTLPDWTASNYRGACDAMQWSTDDEASGDLDPVYTVILNDDGLQSRIASGRF